jgi:hypothetical protein
MMTMTETGAMRTTEAVAARVRSRARLLAAWSERMWSEEQTSPDQGLAITSGEVRRILTDPEVDAERFRRFLTEREAVHLTEAAALAEETLVADEFWSGIVQKFGLSAFECDLLCLGVATELDPRLGRVLAYLADDTRATQPTMAIAASLFGWKDGVSARMPGLLRWRLAQPVNGEPAWRSATSWLVDEAVVLSVRAERWVDPALDRVAKVIEPEDAARLPCLYPGVLAEMLNEHLRIRDRLADFALTGQEGSGRETLAAHFAAALGHSLLSVKTSNLPNTTAPGTVLDGLVRAARLAHATGSVPYWRDAETVTVADWMEVQVLAPMSLRGVQRDPAPATHRFTLPPLSVARRLQLWAHYSDAEPPSIVWTQRLTPAEVKLVSDGHGAANEDPPPALALRRAVTTHRELLQQLPCPYTWDDLVLPAELRRILEDFEAQVRLRWTVYEEWGFARLTHLGQGISALFGGPSGTGKTMAAQVLARSLGLALYRVDLAGVVNKYIGETEKRLRDVFDVCEGAGSLLFFDEADALFGNRTQVKDSHDRFANIEIDYLLQRIEQFEGVAILATNRKNDMDTAFLRRLRFVVEFLNPGKAERLALWQKALPGCSPSGERILGDVDLHMLADELDINGAQIKSIALNAAFLAKDAGAKIGIEQIELAAQREYAKQGLRVRAPFKKAGLT